MNDTRETTFDQLNSSENTEVSEYLDSSDVSLV